MNLKRIILRKKISGFSKTPSETLDTENAGLIIDAKSLRFLKDYRSLFEQAGIKKENLKIIVCDLKETKPPELDAAILNAEDISLFGKFKSEEIRNFIESSFNFLICDFDENSYLGALLVASTKASVKIGKKEDVFNIFDIEIDVRDTKIFQQETLKYLKILNYTN